VFGNTADKTQVHMEIGVIGMNEFAGTLCKHWISRGHRILFADLNLYSKGYSIAEKLGKQVSLTLPEKVGRQAEVIVLAVTMKTLPLAARALGPIQHKIVIDLIKEEIDQEYKLSSFQEIQNLLPGAKIVKVTPDYPIHYKPDPSDSILYFYSNDHLAQRMVRWFVDGSGFRLIDLSIQTII
jgi:predicted dinucleotide-binding enzyme